MSKVKINQLILDEISRLSESHDINREILEKFAIFVIDNYKEKELSRKAKPLTVNQLKESVYQYFGVSNTTELKKANTFKMATRAMGNLNLSQRTSWEVIYRKYIGILPEEEGEQGKDCINGINIFKYFRPYHVFELDPELASKEDIKNAYYRLSKIYHPDNQETGNARIFDRLTVMYKSITTEAK